METQHKPIERPTIRILELLRAAKKKVYNNNNKNFNILKY